MTGFLADLGLDQVEDDPNAMPDGKYPGFVYDAKVVPYRDAAKGKALILTYKVAPGDAQAGKTIDEWKSCNAFDDARTKGFLKARIKSLGVPEGRLATLDPKDLIGTPVTFTKKQNGQYANVTFVEVRSEGEVNAAQQNATAPGSPAADLTAVAGTAQPQPQAAAGDLGLL